MRRGKALKYDLGGIVETVAAGRILPGRLTVLARLAFTPAENIAASPANFAGYQAFFSVLLVGVPDDARLRQLGHNPLASKQ